MKTTPKILVATDFSQPSDHAVEAACKFAKMMGARLLIVHVLPVPSPDQGEGMLHAGLDLDEPDTLKRRLDAIQPSVEGVEIERHLLKGNPATEILKLAEAEDVALIAMSTHGRTGLMRILLGSVAEDVLRRADCPVMMIK